MGDIEGIDADGVEKCPDHGDGQDEKQPLPESGASVVSPQRGVHEWVLSLKHGSTKGAVRIVTSYYSMRSKARGVPPFDCVRKLRLNEKLEMRNAKW